MKIDYIQVYCLNLSSIIELKYNKHYSISPLTALFYKTTYLTQNKRQFFSTLRDKIHENPTRKIVIFGRYKKRHKIYGNRVLKSVYSQEPVGFKKLESLVKKELGSNFYIEKDKSESTPEHYFIIKEKSNMQYLMSDLKWNIVE